MTKKFYKVNQVDIDKFQIEMFNGEKYLTFDNLDHDSTDALINILTSLNFKDLSEE